jgi:hypothetical protein
VAVANLDRAVVDSEVEGRVADEVLVGLTDSSGGIPVGQGRHSHRRPARLEGLGRLALAEAPDAPGDQRAHRLRQIATVLGQVVDLAGGGRGKVSPGDDSVGFERA